LKLQRIEIEKDLRAFRAAYDVLRTRLVEAAETDTPSLENWSGTKATMGSMELSIRYLEREYTDYVNAIYLVEHGEIENVDDDTKKPKLTVLNGGDHE
jgi:hypothetical protein